MSKDSKKNLYSLMDNTYKYSCPYRDSNYHTINNGVNCICTQYKNNNKYNGTTLAGSCGTTLAGSCGTTLAGSCGTTLAGSCGTTLAGSCGTTLAGSCGTTLAGSCGTIPQNHNEKVFINVRK